MRAAVRHEQRLQVRRLTWLLTTAGLPATAALPLVRAGWWVMAGATALAATAPPLADVLPGPVAWTAGPVVLALGVLVLVSLARQVARTTREQRVLLGILGRATATGVVLGRSLPWAPAVVACAGQVLRGGAADPTGATSRLASGIDRFTAGTPAVMAVAGIVVVLVSAGATSASSWWLGRTGLGPRLAAAHRSAGTTVLWPLAAGWLLVLVAGRSDRFDVLTPHVVLASTFVVVLLLRARHVRFLSPEALGAGLFLARDGGAPAARVAGRFRWNAVLLLAPVHGAAAALLVLDGSASVVTLLLALAVSEAVVADAIVLRALVVLPAAQLARLSVESRSALAAALCLGTVFATTGSGGLLTPMDLAGHRDLVLAASVLLGVSSAAVAWLSHLDSPRWLDELRTTVRSTS